MRAQSSPPPPAASTEDPIRLSVFEVVARTDRGYAASSALSGTRTNEKLENLPNAISVLTPDFLADIAANDYFDAVEFATGAENSYNDSGTRGAVGGTRAGSTINFRGLASVRQLRDGFPWYVTQDAYNTERIEVSRGPGGLAYGDVDAGGIIAISTKRARFREAATVQLRTDTFGTRRLSLDFEREIAPNRVALRFNAIDSEVESWRQRAGTDLRGVAAALKLRPFAHDRTSADVTYENLRATAFLSHGPLNDHTRVYVRGSGTSSLDANSTLAGVQANGIGMTRIAPAGAAHAFTLIAGTLYNLQSTATNVFRSSLIVDENAVLAADPQNPGRLPVGPVPESLVPRGEDWGGPDNAAHSQAHALTAELRHTVTDRLNLLLACNTQRDLTNSRSTVAGNVFGANPRAIHLDVNPLLPNPTGAGTIPNPNFEQPYIAHVLRQLPVEHRIDAVRLLAAYDAPLPCGFTQRVVLSGGRRHERYARNFYNYALTPAEIARLGYTGNAARLSNNLITPLHYLKDGNSDERLRFPQSSAGAWFRNTNDNSRFDQSLSSAVLTATGSSFHGLLHTSAGVSRDLWIQDGSLAAIRSPDPSGAFVFTDLAGNPLPEGAPVPLTRLARHWVTNHSVGAVFNATPWLALTAAFQESALFTDNTGLDLQGLARRPTRGEGCDYGLRLRLWDDRVTASLVHFANTGRNIAARLDNTATTELNQVLTGDDRLLGQADSIDTDTRGWELESIANPTRNWTLRTVLATSRTRRTNINPQTYAKLALARTAASAQGRDPDAATLVTRQYLAEQNNGLEDVHAVNAHTTIRYTFEYGRRKGLALGGTLRFVNGRPQEELAIDGVEVIPRRKTPHQYLVSPFASYRRKFGRVTWTGQINVNNVFNRVTDQGRVYRWPRYTDPRQVILTNSLAF
ncbi:MAG: TonB-dependent receptor plug domain-containing protein [Verrucomicrobia bacterium]|nr:TonB-dependent receptor plug domain-containing protein [Verrucomicrobiota bacterium]